MLEAQLQLKNHQGALFPRVVLPLKLVTTHRVPLGTGDPGCQLPPTLPVLGMCVRWALGGPGTLGFPTAYGWGLGEAGGWEGPGEEE